MQEKSMNMTDENWLILEAWALFKDNEDACEHLMDTESIKSVYFGEDLPSFELPLP
jgi:hypothetical protein